MRSSKSLTLFAIGLALGKFRLRCAGGRQVRAG